METKSQIISTNNMIEEERANLSGFLGEMNAELRRMLETQQKMQQFMSQVNYPLNFIFNTRN